MKLKSQTSMPPKPQSCTLCKQPGHNSRNCSGVGVPNMLSIDCDYILNNQEAYDSDDEANQRDTIKLIERKLLKKMVREGLRKQNEPYFFENVLHTAFKILEAKEYLSVILIAQPGSGKTMVMDSVAYLKKTHVRPIMGDRFTIMTGMSDTLCKDALNEGLPFTKEFIQEHENNIGPMIVHHNPLIHKRIEELKRNPLLLLNHTFLNDECHIACANNNTIGKQLTSLGISRDTAKKLKMQFISVSATPDILKKESDQAKDTDSVCIFMEPGPNYRGFEFFKNRILNYTSFDLKLRREYYIHMICEKYTEPKYHFIRIKPGKFHKKLQLELENKDWEVKQYDMHSKKTINIDITIKTPPTTHTFFFIKDMLRQSKRLRLNPYIGTVVEPFKKTDVTLTAQGLLARWWGYYTDADLHNCDPMFIGDFSATETYIDSFKTRIQYKISKPVDFKSYQSNIIDKDPSKIQYEDSDRCGEIFMDTLDDLKEDVIRLIGNLPVNNGINCTHINSQGLIISTKYCATDDTYQGYDKYIPITESKLKNVRKLGKNLDPGGTTLIFIPYYNELLEPESLKWCCRYLKPTYLASIE